MKGLHQQIAEKRQHLTIDQVKVASIHTDPRDAHEAGVRVLRLKKELEALCRDAHLAEAAHADLLGALLRLEKLATPGRELALAKTYLETGAWRLRRHLDEDPNLPSRRDAGAP